MNIKRVPISEVELWEENPRNIKTKDFERLKRQIQELGLYKPLICVRENGRYITLGGNMRLRALQELKQKEVDISIVKAKDEATKIKYALSDNDRAGEYDELQLAELTYPHIEEINLEDYRIDVGEPISLKDVIEDYAPDVDGEDEVPEIDDSPAITKMGDLFQLGKHRLLCGDATKEEDVKRLMNGKKADMAFTDPPYRLKSKFFGYKGQAKYGDLDSDKVFHYSAWLPNVEKISSKDFNICVFEHWYNVVDLWQEMEKFYEIKNLIIWHATNRFSWAHRCLINRYDICLYGVKGNYTFNGKNLRERIDDILGHPVDSVYSTQQEVVLGAKPIGLLKPYLKVLSNKNQNIVDLFGGTGSTLLACYGLGRICFMLEKEPKHCDVIITRFSNFTDIPEEEIRATRQ